MASHKSSIATLALRALQFSSLLGVAESLATRKAPRCGCDEFDYVIVGGGTAGLVMASRLSENPSVTVAVIEAGDFYENGSGNTSAIPANDALYNGKDPADTNKVVEWDFTTTPQAGINNDVVHYERAKTLGGCSAVNFMAYTRPPVGVLKMWADTVGDQSYTWDNLLPYYLKSLNFTPPDLSKRLANATPSYDASTIDGHGLLDVTYPNYAQGLATWVEKALADSGIEPIDGFTSGSLIGSSYILDTINHTTGFRASSETAFLRPFLDRPNLVVYTNTLAEKITFHGTTATGVDVSTANSTFTIAAAKEVILSAGTFQSPQLLMVSGVGPADVLAQNGIPVVKSLPGVGQSMNDHILFGITYRVDVQTSTALFLGGFPTAIEEFATAQDGLISSPGGDFLGFEKVPLDLQANFSAATLADLATFPADWPDLEYISLPAYVGDYWDPGSASPLDGYQYGSIMAISVAPIARGNISISSASMKDQPLINPNWLTTETDQQVAVASFKRLRQFFSTQVLQENLLLGGEQFPGPNITSDADILTAIKKNMNTLYHATSTNKMGAADDDLAVVDPKGCIYGLQNIRVVDASAFPFLPPGMPQSTVYMLAEKIADDIKKGR